MDVTALNMTEEDFKEMKPDMLVTQWAKLQEVAHNLARERDQLRQDVVAVRKENTELQVRLQHALAREQGTKARLAQVADKLIALGALDALSLNVKEADQ